MQTNSNRGDFLRWCRRTLLAAFLLIGLVAVVAWRSFGSIEAAVGFLRGEEIVATPSRINVGSGAAGEVRTIDVRLTSLVNTDIHIVGARTSCTCTAAEGLPVTVPAKDTVIVPVRLRFDAKLPIIDAPIVFFTDSPTHQFVEVSLIGRLVTTD